MAGIDLSKTCDPFFGASRAEKAQVILEERGRESANGQMEVDRVESMRPRNSALTVPQGRAFGAQMIPTPTSACLDSISAEFSRRKEKPTRKQVLLSAPKTDEAKPADLRDQEVSSHESKHYVLEHLMPDLLDSDDALREGYANAWEVFSGDGNVDLLLPEQATKAAPSR